MSNVVTLEFATSHDDIDTPALDWDMDPDTYQSFIEDASLCVWAASPTWIWSLTYPSSMADAEAEFLIDRIFETALLKENEMGMEKACYITRNGEPFARFRAGYPIKLIKLALVACKHSALVNDASDEISEYELVDECLCCQTRLQWEIQRDAYCEAMDMHTHGIESDAGDDALKYAIDACESELSLIWQ